ASELLDKEFIDLSRMQLRRAGELLKETAILIDFGAYNSAVNRAYYAAFHAMKAVEALDNFDAKRHIGVIQYFRQNYIKTGIFEKELSVITEQLQTARGDSDYNISVSFSQQDAKMYYAYAKKIVGAIEAYLRKKYDG
ncbi:MAG: HEPN domain-containing protein, partial [Clostridia bacterium]|nr:HEPN domain-containing protein [Clostridia bacterium]